MKLVETKPNRVFQVWIDKQINIALHGKVKKIDVGICNGKYYLNAVGIGFDGA